MRRIIYPLAAIGFLILAAAAPQPAQGDVTISDISTRSVQPTRNLVNLLRNKITDLNSDIAAARAGEGLGTGSEFYVDSAVGSNSYNGLTWTTPKATLDAAVALCTDNNGDIIYVAQGHAEDWTTTDSVDLDVIGVTVIGCGTGTDRPTFTFDDTDGEFVIGAANCYIYNLAFQPSVAQVVHAIEIEADADGSVIDSCWFMDGETAATDEFIDAVQWTAASDNITVKNCVFESFSSVATNQAHTACDLTAGVVKDTKIINNYIYGFYDEAPIFSDDIDLRSLIAGNVCVNTSTGQYAIEFSTTATGSIIGNYCASDTPGTIIDPGSMETANNIEVDYGAAEDADGGPAWALAKTRPANNYPANVENDSLLAMLMVMDNTGVATVSDYDNDTMSLEALNVDLDAILADTAAVDTTSEMRTFLYGSDTPGATAANQTSILAYLLNGTPDKLTTPANTFTILDILGTDGSTTTGAVAGSILGAIGTNEAASATPFTSSATEADADGSVLEREEYLQGAVQYLAITATSDTSDPVDISAGSEVIDNSVLAHVLTDDGDASDFDRRLSSLERISMWQQVQMAYGNATPGYAHPTAYWFVDANISVSGDGKTPYTAFKTIDEAITAASNSVEDFIIVWDYSGSAGTITIDKSWVHLIGMNGSTHPYPRIAATTGHGITLSTGAGRIEICGFTIGAQATKAGIGLDSGSASQVHIHNCHFGIDASSACQEGIYVAAGADAVDLVVEDCEFKTAITQEGIEIAGNATWGRIRNNLFIGCTASDTYPAINLSGGVVGIAVEGNRIGGGTDDAAGWGISLSAGSSECWIDGNHVNDGKIAVGFNPFEDGAANAWGLNYADITATLP